MKTRTRVALWVALCLLVFCACSPEMRRTLGGLSMVNDSVAARYHPESGQVSLLNEHTLAITLVNVPGREVFKPANKEWARGVAQFAYAAYPDRKNITNVTVTLTKQHYVLFVSIAQTEHENFKPDELFAVPAVR